MNYNAESFYNIIAKTNLGRNLWLFLTNESIIKALIEKANQGRTSVEAVDSIIKSKFGNEIDSLGKSKSDKYKKMIGHMIGQTLMSRGFRKINSKSLSGCSYFTHGHIFQKR